MNLRRILPAAVVACLLAAVAHAGAPAVEAPAWHDLGPRLEEAGVPGGRHGIEVDRATGDLYLAADGVYRSGDRGETWRRLDDGAVVGKQWYSFALTLDPRTARLAVFKKDPPEETVRGAISTDAGRTWQPVERVRTEQKYSSFGWSWGVVDWSTEDPRTIIARMHHTERMWLSRDAGRTWSELSVHSKFMGLYEENTFVAYDRRKGQVLRSADGGQNWSVVAEDLEVTVPLPVRFGDRLYWVVRDGLAVSDDAGRTWRRCAARLQDAYWGPYFGPTEHDIIVVTLDGVHLTRDGGESWLRICDNKAVQDSSGFGKPDFRMDWFIGLADWAWDPVDGMLYLSHRGLWRLDLQAAERAARESRREGTR